MVGKGITQLNPKSKACRPYTIEGAHMQRRQQLNKCSRHAKKTMPEGVKDHNQRQEFVQGHMESLLLNLFASLPTEPSFDSDAGQWEWSPQLAGPYHGQAL